MVTSKSNDQTLYQFDDEDLSDPAVLISTFYGVTGKNADKILNNIDHSTQLLLQGISGIGTLLSNSIQSKPTIGINISSKIQAESDVAGMLPVLAKIILGMSHSKSSVFNESEKYLDDQSEIATAFSAEKGGAK